MHVFAHVCLHMDAHTHVQMDAQHHVQMYAHTHAYTLPCMSVFCVCGRDLCEDIHTHTHARTMQDQRHTYQGDTQTDMKVMQQNQQQ